MNQRKTVIPEGWDIALVICFIAGVGMFGTLLGSAVAQKVEKGVPKQQRTLALAEDEVRQLMLMMDIDKSGKVSKQEFMHFMEAEFDRLDKDKSGELDVRAGPVADSAKPASGW
jgi:EF hand